MTRDSGQITIKENEERQRYEIYVGDQLAGHTEYRPVGHARLLPHTEINERYEGQGLGSQLIQFALDDLRARGLNAVPTCPFVVAFIRKHPDYLELVQPGQRRALKL
ncbi:GNAT family N-acetyltransferase [Deinococcus humi]|uniref:N-acetyltransferase domain-containing protein n=1 Tax=Deinococcus humi TaxID=662880 RepID=A0A7W8K0J8_9DEIO|nr:GNAT family N-acetyltransferase [Deinococcus humi]MBB5366415.1 hypothetical protein [Deinococcus humi]GGO41626.1 N-acetyltransferase [Deinococcus humi]